MRAYGSHPESVRTWTQNEDSPRPESQGLSVVLFRLVALERARLVLLVLGTLAGLFVGLLADRQLGARLADLLARTLLVVLLVTHFASLFVWVDE